MDKGTYIKIALFVSGFGVLFSGFLTSYYYVFSSCIPGLQCRLLLNIPICAIGFVLFLLTHLTLVIYKIQSKNILQYSLFFSGLGLGFSLFYVIDELFIRPCLSCTYALFLPVCVYGFIAFLITTISLYKVIKYEKV